VALVGSFEYRGLPCSLGQTEGIVRASTEVKVVVRSGSGFSFWSWTDEGLVVAPGRRDSAFGLGQTKGWSSLPVEGRQQGRGLGQSTAPC
jgi:hypothetical protein